MRKDKYKVFYYFDSRGDVVRQVFKSYYWFYLRGFECPVCGRLRIFNRSPRRIMEFSQMETMGLPSDVDLELRRVGDLPEDGGSCSRDGTPMRPLTRPADLGPDEHDSLDDDDDD